MNFPQQGLVLAAIGAAIFALTGWPISKARRARRWPKTKATVIASKVSMTTDSPGRNVHRYRVEVVYRYAVQGQPHQSDRLSYFEMQHRHVAERWAEQQRKQYSKRAALVIRYDPSNPGESVVHTNVPGGFYFGAGFGLFLAVVGLLFAVR